MTDYNSYKGNANMKKYSLIFAVVLVVVGAPYLPAAGNDWHIMQTGRQDNLNALFFCNSTNGFLISGNSNGVILRSSPEENRWIADSTPGTVLQEIFFFKDCKRGFVCGSHGTFSYSDDSGLKWTSLNFDTSLWLYDVAFMDSLTGFLVGGNLHSRITFTGVAYKTSDGGHTWDSIPLGGVQFSALDIAPDGVVTIKGQNKIYISHDNGIRWDTVTAPPGESPNAVCIRGKAGLMVGMGGYAASSADGGKTWKTLNVLADNMHLFDLLMLDEKKAYAVGSEGLVLFTDDCGKNWIPEASGTPQQLTDIKLFGNRIYACGQGGALIYKDIDLPKPSK